MAKAAKQIKVTLVKSVFGQLKAHRATVRGLGPAPHPQTRDACTTRPENRGMINAVELPVAGRGGLTMQTERHLKPARRQQARRACASAAARPPARARPAAAASRASARARAATTRSASKAARCRCSAACRKSGFRSKIKAPRAEVRLSELAKVDGDLIDLDVAEGGGSCRSSAERAQRHRCPAKSTRR